MSRRFILSSETASSKSSSEQGSFAKLPLALKPPVRRRKQLPCEQIHGAAISLVSILTKSLPICLFEPLSEVQIIAEECRYANQFLNKMSSTKDPVERLSLLCGHIVSGYSGMIGRSRMPFKPLLGETYDYISEDGWRYHSEQVNFHPSITACHAEGLDWELFQAIQMTISFALNSVSITPNLPVRLKLSNGDEYSWNKVTTKVQNVRAEAQKRRVLNDGKMIIKTNTGLEGRLTFSGSEDNAITGEIFRIRDKVVLYHFFGSWDKGLSRISPDRKVSKIFEPIPLSTNAVSYYGFSDFATTLNELHDSEYSYLPATDSRYRPDKRYLENSEAKLAEQTLKKLEQAQNRRVGLQHKPLWFHKKFDKFTGDLVWHSNKQYWTSKEAQFQDEHSQQMLQLFEKKH